MEPINNDFVTKIIVDANVWIGFLNKRDFHHKKCLDFFLSLHKKNKNTEKISVVMPMHSLIEINTKIRKLKRGNNWESMASGFFFGQENYDIDLNLIKRIEASNIYDCLGQLGSQDAIYAAIAYIEKIPLVTLDKDFEKVKDIIEVIQL